MRLGQFIVGCCTIFIVSIGSAQSDNVTTNHTRRVTATVITSNPKPVRKNSTNRLHMIQRPQVEYDGLLPNLKRTRNPLNLINPFAPLPKTAVYRPRFSRIDGRRRGISFLEIRF